jgi:hypothetical protein
MVAWVKFLGEHHFDKLYLAGLFLMGAVILHFWGSNPAVSDWVQKGAVIGAMLMLITGNKKSPEPPAGGK